MRARSPAHARHANFLLSWAPKHPVVLQDSSDKRCSNPRALWKSRGRPGAEPTWRGTGLRDAVICCSCRVSCDIQQTLPGIRLASDTPSPRRLASTWTAIVQSPCRYQTTGRSLSAVRLSSRSGCLARDASSPSTIVILLLRTTGLF